MCGRYTLSASPEAIQEHFQLSEWGNLSLLEPRYNIAPSQNVSVIFQPESGSEKDLSFMKWGLIPHWAKDSKIGYKMINARAETLTDKPAYRAAFKRQRCLIPADGFYEWKTLAGRKQPHHFRYHGSDVFAFAGLWEYWKGDKEIYSCTIITTEADDNVKNIHSRMPVILPHTFYDKWLDPDIQDTDALRSLLISETDDLEIYPVTTRVNSPNNQGAVLVEKMEQ